MIKMKNGKELSSRPLLGVLISLLAFSDEPTKKWVLVPFSGFLYLYGKLFLVDVNEFLRFSSPSRGSYISTLSSQSLELYTHISAFAAQM